MEPYNNIGMLPLYLWPLVGVIVMVYITGLFIMIFDVPDGSLWDFVVMLARHVYLDLRDWCRHILTWYKKDEIIVVSVEKVKDTYKPIAKRFSKKVIGVVSFENTPLYQHAYKEFSKQVKAMMGDDYVIVGYNANNDKDSMAAIMSNIRDVQHSLILAIGPVAALCLKEAQKHFSYDVPVLFIGVERPVELGIVESLESSGSLFTGVVGMEHNYERQMQIVPTFSKNLRKILIPFSHHDPWVVGDIEEVCRMLRPFCTSIRSIGYRSSLEFKRDVIVALTTEPYDMVITMRDTMSVDNLDALVAACNQNATPIYASDTLALTHGVAMAFGEDYSLYAQKATEMAYTILKQGVHPSSLPVQVVSLEQKFWVDTRSARKQGITNHSVLNNLVKQSNMCKK